MAAFAIKFTGLKKMQRAAALIGRDLSKRSEQGVMREARRILKRSQELVPVVTGDLKRSGVIEGPYKFGGKVHVNIDYGAAYASYVHEGTQYFEGRKFLERAMNEAETGMSDRLAQDLKL